MNWQWILILHIIAVTWIAWMTRKIYALHLSRLERLADWHSRYCRSADRLLEFPLSNSMLEQVIFWNNVVATPDGARKLLMAIFSLRGRQGATSPNKPERKVDDKEAAEAFIDFALNAMMLASFRSLVWGFILRAKLAEILLKREAKQTTDFAAEIAELNPIKPRLVAHI